MKKQFHVWCPDLDHTEDDGCLTLSAVGEAAAAELWASYEDSHSAEYSIVGGREEPIVCVRELPDGGVVRMRVTGMAEPVYTARRVD